MPRRLVLQGLGATAVLTTAPACREPDKADPAGDSRGAPEVHSRPPDTGAPQDDSQPLDTGSAPERGDFNVLYISTDELHPLYLACFGHPDAQTPRLDALRAEGVSCAKVYVASPVCAPTRQSLLSGLHPLEHGQYSNSYVFNELYPTLAEYISGQGFSTACFGKLHTQNDEETFTFGFDTLLGTHSGARWDEVVDRYTDGLPWPSADPEDEALFHEMPFDFGGKPLDDLERSDDWILAQEAIAWLREHADERFFLYVSFRAPHYPFDLPAELYYLHDPDEISIPEVVEGDRDDSTIATYWYEEEGWGGMTEAHVRLVLARYLGAVAWVDRLVGMLLDALAELGLEDRTLVAFTSDHGDMCGEKGLWLKNVFFEPAARKPLLLRMPGWLSAGAEDDLLLSEVDLWPTVLGLVEAAAGLSDWSISGQDRSAALLDPEVARPDQVFATIGAPNDEGQPWMTMVRDARWKLWRYRGSGPESRSYELYDMVADPSELDNLAEVAEHAGVVAGLDEAITGFLGGLREPLFEPERSG